MAIRDFYFIIGDSPLYVCTIIIIEKDILVCMFF